MKDLSELRIYRLAVEVAEEVWTWDNFAKWCVGKQLVDAADGIGATMIEGYYPHGARDQGKFFSLCIKFS